MSEQRARLLVLAQDERVREEFTTALEPSAAATRPRATFVGDERQLVEAARAIGPELVLAPLEFGARRLRGLADEIEAVAPGATLVGVIDPESTTGGEADGRAVIEALRAGVHDFLRRPISSTEISELLSRWYRRPREVARPSATLVSFVSNKGGVGKSTLAVNASVDLARSGDLRVLLVDLSLQLGVCASMLDLKPRTTILDAVRERERLDETLLVQLTTPHETGLRLLAAPMRAEDAAEIDGDAVTRVLGLARRAFDVVLIDTFPLLDAVVVAVLDVSDLVYVVVQGFVPTVIGAASLLGTLDAIGQPEERRRVVLSRNHAAFTGSLAATDIEARLARRIDHEIPYHKGLLAAVNTGRPAVLSAWRGFGFGRALSGLSEEIRASRARARADATP